MSADLLRLTVFVGERARHDGRFVADALLDGGGAATSVVLRGAAGFGPRHDIRSDFSLSMSEDPPIAVVAVDTAARIGLLADRAAHMATRGTLALERVHDVAGSALPDHVELTVSTGRGQRLLDRPAHVTVCALLREHGFACATSLLGVDGIVAGQRRRARFVGSNRTVPVLTVAVGSAAAIGDAVDGLRRLLPTAPLTVAPVRLCAAPGRPTTRPDTLAPTDDRGRAWWHKVTIHTSEADLHDGVPVHRALVRALRDTPTAAGVTVLRGVWGFAGARDARGDSLFQLGRRVPVTTQYLDTPDGVAATFGLVERIAGPGAVVTSGRVPALVSVDGGRRRGGTALASAPDEW